MKLYRISALLLSSGLLLHAQVEVTSSGVGVGTSAPSFPMDVSTGADQYAKPAVNILPSSHGTSERAALGFGFTSSAITDGWILGQDLNGTGVRDFYLLSRAASTSATRLFINTSGNMGIGTTNPTSRLQVEGGDIAIGQDGTNRRLLIWSNTEGADAILIRRSDNSSPVSIATSAYGKSLLFKVGGSEIVRFSNDGNVGIGTTAPAQKLHVAGSVRATSFIADVNTYADFVFKSDYRLASLAEVEAHIETHGHLPDIPSEAEVREQGIDLASMQVKLLQKIEELTLHQIAQEKRLTAQAGRIAALEQENHQLRNP